MFIGEEEYQAYLYLYILLIRYRSEIVRSFKVLKNLDGTPVDPKEADPNYWKMKKAK